MPNATLLRIGCVAVLTVGGTGGALAQVAVSGDNYLNPTTNTLSVGDGFGSSNGVGSLSIEGGVTGNAPALSLGEGGTGNGTVLIDGAGTNVTLQPVGQANILQIGNWGVGAMTVSGGAVVTGDPTGCTDWCNAYIGNAAGSTGTLTITGSGSALNFPAVVPNIGTTRFIVGQDAVLKIQGQPSFSFGTPGGSTTGILNLTAGGSLSTGDAFVGLNGNIFTQTLPLYTVATGGETASGNVQINNATWNIASPDWGGLTLGEGPNATGNLTVSNHGAVNLSSSVAGQSVNLTLGDQGGTGNVTVDGGAINFTSGSWDQVSVGNYKGSGSLTVKNGGSVTGAYYAMIGQDGSTGSLHVSGAGSLFELSGVNGGSGGVYMGVGQANDPSLGPTTKGMVTVDNGGHLTIDTDGNGGGAGLGVAVDGGTGTVTVTGIGSQIAVTGNNGNLNYSGGATIGESGKGTLNVLAGGQFIVNNTGTAANAGFAIGGDGYQVGSGAQAGVGVVNVSGTGSQLNIESAHGTIYAGYSGQGTLNVSNGGAVSAELLQIGSLAGSKGIVSVNSGSIALSGSDASGQFGAAVQVGAEGAGYLTLANGSSLNIHSASSYAGIAIGYGYQQGGVGVMTVTGGSQALVSGPNSVLDVGATGSGTLNVSGGSTVDVAHDPGSTGRTFVGALPPEDGMQFASAHGVINLSGGSTLDAGSLLAIASDGVNSTPGTGSVKLSGMSTINATNIVVGQNGLLGGDGVINGNVTVDGGTVASDPLYINGDFTQVGGVMEFDVFSNGNGGFDNYSLVFAPGDAISISGAQIVIDFLGGASEAAFKADGLFNLDTFFRVGDVNGDAPLSRDYALNSVFTNDTLVVGTPEPGTMTLVALGAAGLIGRGLRKGARRKAAA